jgi:hypothetical protein
VCIGAASGAVYGLPGREYFKNEMTNRLWRVRPAARDLGAFESTSASNPVGPYDPPPLPQLSLFGSGSTRNVQWPLFGDDFLLERTVSLNPAAWTSAGLALSTNVFGIQVTIPSGTDQAFFRLRK